MQNFWVKTYKRVQWILPNILAYISGIFDGFFKAGLVPLMTLFRLHMVKQILPSGRIVSWSPWSSWKCLPSLRSCKNLSGWPRTSRNYLPAPGRIIYYRRPSVEKWVRLPETVEAEKMGWLDLPRGTSYPTFPYPRCYLKARRYPPTSAAPVSIVGMGGGGGELEQHIASRDRDVRRSCF